MYRGVKHRFFESHNFRKFAGFWCGYCCIKHDKTASTVSILIKFHTIVVEILIKHTINEVLYFWVKKVVFEQLKLCHLERIAFHRNWRWSCRKHPLKIVPWSVNPFQSLQEFEVDNTKKYAQLILNFFWVVYYNTDLVAYNITTRGVHYVTNRSIQYYLPWRGRWCRRRFVGGE